MFSQNDLRETKIEVSNLNEDIMISNKECESRVVPKPINFFYILLESKLFQSESKNYKSKLKRPSSLEAYKQYINQYNIYY